VWSGRRYVLCTVYFVLCMLFAMVSIPLKVELAEFSIRLLNSGQTGLTRYRIQLIIPDRLSILSLVSIKRLQEELVHTSSQASALLAWQLQMKDAQAQDSAT
jgi:TRAP-type mannitol/chloroaromatic compound transport system permease small subunit